jgi:hypothetical protein
MAKSKDKVETEEEGSDSENFICEVMGWRISATSRQYILNRPSKNKKEKNGILVGYYRCFSDSLDDLREQLMRLRIVGSGTLDKVIDNLNKFNREWNAAIAPLKKYEEELIWGHGNLKK